MFTNTKSVLSVGIMLGTASVALGRPGIQPTARLEQPAPMGAIVWPRHRVKSRA